MEETAEFMLCSLFRGSAVIVLKYSYVNVFAIFEIKCFAGIVKVGVVIWISEISKPEQLENLDYCCSQSHTEPGYVVCIASISKATLQFHSYLKEE